MWRAGPVAHIEGGSFERSEVVESLLIRFEICAHSRATLNLQAGSIAMPERPPLTVGAAFHSLADRPGDGRFHRSPCARGFAWSVSSLDLEGKAVSQSI
jgi:hypothetical protein